jgi:hypothetical protein
VSALMTLSFMATASAGPREARAFRLSSMGAGMGTGTVIDTS